MLDIKSRILALLGVVIVGSGLFGATQVLAQANNGNYPSFVQQLAQKLGIDQSKVQQAVDEIRQDHKSQIQTRFGEKEEALDLVNKAIKIAKENKVENFMDKAEFLKNRILNPLPME